MNPTFLNRHKHMCTGFWSSTLRRWGESSDMFDGHQPTAMRLNHLTSYVRDKAKHPAYFFGKYEHIIDGETYTIYIDRDEKRGYVGDAYWCLKDDIYFQVWISTVRNTRRRTKGLAKYAHSIITQYRALGDEVWISSTNTN